MAAIGTPHPELQERCRFAAASWPAWWPATWVWAVLRALRKPDLHAVEPLPESGVDAVVVVVTGGGEVDGGGDGAGGQVGWAARAVQRTPRWSHNPLQTVRTTHHNRKKPRFLYPRPSTQDDPTSYYEQSEPSMSRARTSGASLSELASLRGCDHLHVSSVPLPGPVENPTPLLLFIYG
jgi:hypothetical protein